MKLITFFLLVSMASVTANSYSQQAKFTMNLENGTVSQVFQKIENTSEFIFIYSEKSVDVNRKVNVKVEDETINSILDQLFKGTTNSYEIHDRQIVILPLEIKELPLLIISGSKVEQPQKKELKGKVTDFNGGPIPGTTVFIKGTTFGTITDKDGNFSLQVPLDVKTLVFSFIGYKTQGIQINGNTKFDVMMLEEQVGLEDVVVVGYGTQKKASVVGAITTTTGEELQRTGGVTNLAQALTGNLPGVTTIQTTGQPGMADPKIYIRGQSTWNGGEPYILVDGVERRMNDIDMSEVDNISVLKDASATAVYGVKGANGVIMITTKRGSKGKSVLSVSANTSMKIPSRLVSKLDAYDMYGVKNESIEREVVLNESGWSDYTPLAIVSRYRNQQNLKYPEAYPNIDWQKETIKDFAMDQRVNLNVEGGNDFAKYFSSLAYLHEGDLMKIRDNGRNYTPGFGYDRFNFRTNLDLNITKTTTLKVNLAGIYAVTKENYKSGYKALIGAYALPANAYMPQYSDGRWGASTNKDERMENSAMNLAMSGIRKTHRTDLTSDLSLTQKLDFITQGLSLSGKVSFDNYFESAGGIQEPGTDNVPTKWINPEIEDMPPGEDPNNYIIVDPVAGQNQFAWIQNPWIINDENAGLSTLRRRLYYQGQINYAQTFGKHDVATTGIFTREQLATGSEFPRYREDWIMRVTYNYDNRYLAELNGAYNGSEKFGPGYRFGFFPSAAVGWTISNEKFMKNISWLDKLKLRYSYGLIGDDNISQRWLYESQYYYGGNLALAEYGYTTVSPYTIYREQTVGNPDAHWEKAKKTNLGLEMAVLKNIFNANVEYFTEDRTDILLNGASREIPPYFGTSAPTANIGRVKKNGYEVELRFNKNLQNWHFWANVSMSHAVDKILYKEEGELKDPHMKAQDFQIDQTKSTITGGFINTWDNIYASIPYVKNDQHKLPGDYYILDFNADGNIDPNYDAAPYGYSTRPQNAYNLTLGTDYKGFSWMVQFYGVNNVTRYVPFHNFISNIDIVYSPILDYWRKDNLDATSFLPRWKTTNSAGQYSQYDGSYLRLKNAELAYTFSGERLKYIGVSSLKLYLNGHNLIFWSKLPDDREAGSDRYGAYPTSSRINLGIDIKF